MIHSLHRRRRFHLAGRVAVPAHEIRITADGAGHEDRPGFSPAQRSRVSVSLQHGSEKPPAEISRELRTLARLTQ